MITKYPCPNPVKGGCGCPRSSSRCYGAIRAVREAYRANDYDVEATLAQCGPGRGWTGQEILDRFGGKPDNN